MEIGRSPQWTKTANENSMLRTVVLACGVAVLSYLSAKLFGSALISAQADWPLWLGNVLLVSVLVLVPRRMWPILMAAAFAANVLYDLQTGLTIRTTSVLILTDTFEVLTAAFCLTYFFDGVPRLDSVKALAKYSFFAVFLTPLIGASVGAFAESSDYWTNWRIIFFSEAIVYLTLLPAILGWVSKAPAGTRRSGAYYLEAAALFAALIFFGYLTFVGPERISPQTLFYSLVPFLLWSALRFGSTGVSTSVIVIAFLAIWGVAHGRGPFIEPGPLNNVSSLQVFLFFTASPFMVLAALVEERSRTIEALRESETRERARVKELETLLDAAPIPILIARDAECKYVTANRAGYQLYCVPIGANFSRNASPIEPPQFRIVRDGVEIATEELPLQRAAATGMPVFGSSFTLLLKEGAEHHMIGNAVPLFGEDGKARGAIGAFVDITDRKRAEEGLRRLSGQLLRLQDEERRRIARDLHDSTGQDLVALATMLSQLRGSIPSGERKSRRLHSECKALADHCVREVRTLSYLLHPPVLDQAGLEHAIRDYVQGFTTRSGIQVELELSPCVERMARDVELALFRVVQEGLTNIQRHSGSQQAKIRIYRNSGLTLEISDLGRGVSASVYRRNEEPRFQVGVGIPSMQERVKLIGGRLDIVSTNHGTTVRVTIPLGGERT
jgi:signal transduction histidine kinase